MLDEVVINPCLVKIAMYVGDTSTTQAEGEFIYIKEYNIICRIPKSIGNTIHWDTQIKGLCLNVDDHFKLRKYVVELGYNA